MESLIDTIYLLGLFQDPQWTPKTLQGSDSYIFGAFFYMICSAAQGTRVDLSLFLF